MKDKKNKKKNSRKVCTTHVAAEVGRLAERERRLKDLEQLTLLSDVFMSVALSDLKACQHVVRILTGNPEIMLVSVKTQSSRMVPDWMSWQRTRIKHCIILR